MEVLWTFMVGMITSDKVQQKKNISGELWQIGEKDMGILRRNTIRRRIAAFPVKNMR